MDEWQSRIAPPAKYCPHQPWARQQLFMLLDCREAFYGGAAGGGKSEALLMAALQYVHVPGYAALILRKDTRRLRLAGGLIARSHEWLAGSGATWNESRQQWRFETGGDRPATLSFGYLQTSRDKFRYGSSEYQYIAFDELCELEDEADYRFLFSRLRRPKGMRVPLRMRAAGNPGGPGHGWVKSRFIGGKEAEQAASAGRPLIYNGPVAWVPARIDDNPALDGGSYRASLAHLPPVVRDRLLHGDWSISSAGLIRPDWIRQYVQRTENGLMELLSTDGKTIAEVFPNDCRRIVTIDPAGTSEDRARESRGRSPSWTVAMVWDIPPRDVAPALILREVVRRRVGFDGLCEIALKLHEKWTPREFLVEREKLGQALCDVLEAKLPIRSVPIAGRDKVARAGPLIAMLERGEVYLPRGENCWRPVLESEWFTWTGLPEETSDQVDAAAYAAAEYLANPPYPRVIELLPFHTPMNF